ncbi:hypothetical protein EVAR_62073_1 [Eumeta japonica]|uniref:Uncharacterized protein n=1 Tax=Eumeta variegata TaxID=151549 RepID=A0A4C1YZ39_EUMVA|nr:hypothetical protein EVAR_62073_1 [Eumeta japonica]
MPRLLATALLTLGIRRTTNLYPVTNPHYPSHVNPYLFTYPASCRCAPVTGSRLAYVAKTRFMSATVYACGLHAPDCTPPAAGYLRRDTELL